MGRGLDAKSPKPEKGLRNDPQESSWVAYHFAPFAKGWVAPRRQRQDQFFFLYENESRGENKKREAKGTLPPGVDGVLLGP